MQVSNYTEDNFMELMNESAEQSRLLSYQVEREFILLAKIERLERLIAKLTRSHEYEIEHRNGVSNNKLENLTFVSKNEAN